MVVFVHLDSGETDPHRTHEFAHNTRLRDSRSYLVRLDQNQHADNERPNPNFNSFSASLACYPVASKIAQYLDLNSLHNLSACCRQFRANLIQYRDQLVHQTLRCRNEVLNLSLRLTERCSESHEASTNLQHSILGDKTPVEYITRCARDMVGECKRCQEIVCRNCIIKRPSSKSFRERHRRLCRTCMKAPLQLHIMSQLLSSIETKSSFTFDAFSREPCSCVDSVFLCVACGTGLRNTDVTYFRGWKWRTRYSTYLGGLGTGIGEGNEGVECGKGDLCLAVREVEKEIDCSADELAELQRHVENVERQGRQRAGSSYLAQEIEGIGGIVKKKVKKRVRVGAVVKEYEDERESGSNLGREQRGENRSWCHWCLRVIPGKKDYNNNLSRTFTDSSSSSIRSHGADRDSG